MFIILINLDDWYYCNNILLMWKIGNGYDVSRK